MIYLGADHAGFSLKEKVKAFLEKKNIKYKDLGTYSTKSVDASDYAVEVAKKVKRNKEHKGILICGSSVMMGMAANRIKGVRAAVCWNQKIAKQAREHNNANTLVLSGREFVPKNWKKIIEVFLKTKALTKARYIKRIKKLDKIK